MKYEYIIIYRGELNVQDDKTRSEIEKEALRKIETSQVAPVSVHIGRLYDEKGLLQRA